MEHPKYKPPFFDRVLLIPIYSFINRFVPWHKLPSVIGALNLGAMREELRRDNLHDVYPDESAQGNAKDDPAGNTRFHDARNSDGKYNSLEQPLMGCSGMRFGRNFPRSWCKKPTDEELLTPNPRLVSERFMARKAAGFIPATTLNLLAAAWIQFENHDWFVHENAEEKYDIPLPPGHNWSDTKMVLPKTKPDNVLDAADTASPGYKNKNTPWWDGSQIYGSDEAQTEVLRNKRDDGKLELKEDGREAFLPRDAAGNPLTGFNDNWWIGMELLHTLFALEHNALCDMLKAKHPDWKNDQIFDKARLINCALMAKIHTVEWTPAILAHPAVKLGMNTNWWGMAGENLNKLLGRISKSDIISGIPGSGANQTGCPYSLTEEFVSVYRMHPLIPDNIAFFDVKDGAHKSTTPVVDTIFTKAQDPLNAGVSFADAFYSFGINYPGAVTNNNYPQFLMDLHTPDGQHRDLGTVDILRDRERGVPRYNQFRRGLRMSAPKTFEELTGGNKELAQELSEVYNGDIELVDALVGMHSEPLPKGFGFSDTAFRIFILMASRRLKSDRFIATQWNDATYTKEGIHWVQNNGMREVLIRHFPDLKPIIGDNKNVFAPWKKLPESAKYTGVETNAPKA